MTLEETILTFGIAFGLYLFIYFAVYAIFKLGVFISMKRRQWRGRYSERHW